LASGETPSKSAAIPADPMTLWKCYYVAGNLDDALEILSDTVDDACIIAGGTDLLIDLQQGRHPPVHTLVDVSNIPELNCLEIREDRLFIGASAPLNQLIENALMREHGQAIVEACRLIGGPQVRNVATLGGNVAHALPGADGTIALLSLNASAEIRDKEGFREVPLVDLFAGPGRSTLRPKNEILTGFYITCRESHQASSFNRVMRPQGVALPILNIAIWIERKDNIFRDARIAVGPSGPIPRRATTAENALRSERYSEESIEMAYQEMLKQLSFRTSPLRASSGYRRHLSEILFKSVINVAYDRAAV
jgi:xanthine dehydrogenase FAD-binding subunit